VCLLLQLLGILPGSLTVFLFDANFTQFYRGFVVYDPVVQYLNPPSHSHIHSHTNFVQSFRHILGSRLDGVVVSVFATGPKDSGFEPGQGDGFLRAIKIRSTPSSRMGSKAGRSHVVRF
jgi:hypothetical protein